MFAAYITGLAVKRNKSLTISFSSSLSSISLAGVPFSSSAYTLSRRSASTMYFLSPPFAELRALAALFCTLSISAKISSNSIVSISLKGFTLPSTCVMLASSKHLTTCTIASTSLICDKNLLPSPSPFDAPFTSPAMSTNSSTVGVTFLLL